MCFKTFDFRTLFLVLKLCSGDAMPGSIMLGKMAGNVSHACPVRWVLTYIGHIPTTTHVGSQHAQTSKYQEKQLYKVLQQCPHYLSEDSYVSRNQSVGEACR